MIRYAAERRITETFRQRYGWTGAPLEITWREAAKRVDVLDTRTGRRAEYDYAGKRLVRVWDNEAEQPA